MEPVGEVGGCGGVDDLDCVADGREGGMVSSSSTSEVSVS